MLPWNRLIRPCESEVATEPEVDAAEDAEGHDANHRQQFRRVPRLNLETVIANLAENQHADESDDATGSPGMVLASPANP